MISVSILLISGLAISNVNGDTIIKQNARNFLVQFGQRMGCRPETVDALEALRFVHGKIEYFSAVKQWVALENVCWDAQSQIFDLNMIPNCANDESKILAACLFLKIQQQPEQLNDNEFNRVKQILQDANGQSRDNIGKMIRYAEENETFKDLWMNWSKVVKVCHRIYDEEQAAVHKSNQYKACHVLRIGTIRRR